MSWHRHAHSREWRLLTVVPGLEVHPRTTFGLSVRFETEPDLTPTGEAVAELEIVVPEFPDQEDPVTFHVHYFHLTAAQAIEAGSVLVRIGEACLPGGRLEDLDLVRDTGRRDSLLVEIDRLLSLKGPEIQMLSADTRRVLEWVKGRLTGEGVATSEEVKAEVPEGVVIRRALGLPDDEPIEHVLDIMCGLKAGGLVTPSRHEAAREINEALHWLDDEPETPGAVVHLAAALGFLGEPMPEEDGEPRFYLLDSRSCVGNCALWWRPDGKGYTCELDQAGTFTLDEARSHRSTDVPVPVSVAQHSSVRHVRWDALRAAGVRFDGPALDDYLARLDSEYGRSGAGEAE